MTRGPRSGDADVVGEVGDLVRRAKRFAMVLVLTFALFVLDLVAACDLSGGSEEPAVYYGPPPADASGDTRAVDVPGPLPDVGADAPLVFYGPVPVDAIDDTQPRVQDVPAVYYGPVPVDAVDDTQPRVDDVPAVYYGPVPVDAFDDVPPLIDDVPAVYYGPIPADAVDDAPQVWYGPPPLDATDGGPADVTMTDCEPMAYYGPPPCSSDADCVAWYGEGWYCDKAYSFSDPCGDPISWPTCVPAE